jgi:hypothetical protein
MMIGKFTQDGEGYTGSINHIGRSEEVTATGARLICLWG